MTLGLDRRLFCFYSRVKAASRHFVFDLAYTPQQLLAICELEAACQ